MSEETWRGKPIGYADTADLRRNLPDLPSGDYEVVQAELQRRDELGERWFDNIVTRLTDEQRTALQYIWSAHGRLMPHTEEMASVLATLGSRVRARPDDLVREARGGIEDPNFTGSGVFHITSLGRVVAERLFGPAAA